MPLAERPRRRRRSRRVVSSPTKRLAVYHAFCELSPVAQTVLADVVLWVRKANPQSRRQLLACLNALARFGPLCLTLSS